MGLAVAREKTLRERLLLRVGWAISNSSADKVPGSKGDRLSQFYRARIDKEFPISWESFISVLGHITDVLNLNARTVRKSAENCVRLKVAAEDLREDLFSVLWEGLDAVTRARESERRELSAQIAYEHEQGFEVSQKVVEELRTEIPGKYQLAFRVGRDNARLSAFLTEPFAWRFPEYWRRLDEDHVAIMFYGTAVVSQPQAVEELPVNRFGDCIKGRRIERFSNDDVWVHR